MDLLTSLLRSIQAEPYSENFKKVGIDPFTLKILSEKDLITLGIEDEKERHLMLQNIANLQIPAEKKMDIVIDDEYLKSVLYQMLNQFYKHLANLSCAVKREDVIICDLKLEPSVICLRNCVESLEKRLNELDNLINKRKQKSYLIQKAPTLLGFGTAFILVGYAVFKLRH